MKTKIETLTPEQEAAIPAWQNEWIKHGFSCEPADWESAEKAVKDAYVVAGLKPPKTIMRLASPYEGESAAAILKNTKFDKNVVDQVVDQVMAQIRAQIRAQVVAQLRYQVRDQFDQVVDQFDHVGDHVMAQVRAQVVDQVGAAFFSQHEAGFLSWISYFSRFIGLPNTQKIDALLRIAESCGGVWFFDGAAIITDRPKIICRDEQDRLHCETGPALEYRDGFAVYAWHGTRIPKEWIEDKSSITPKIALTWQNIEQRRVAIEIVGWAKILRELDAKVIDQDGDPQIGTLVEVRLPDLETPARFCRVLCGTGREFAVCVPPTVKTAIEAQSWMFGLSENEFMKPEVRT